MPAGWNDRGGRRVGLADAAPFARCGRRLRQARMRAGAVPLPLPLPPVFAVRNVLYVASRNIACGVLDSEAKSACPAGKKAGAPQMHTADAICAQALNRCGAIGMSAHSDRPRGALASFDARSRRPQSAAHQCAAALRPVADGIRGHMSPARGPVDAARIARQAGTPKRPRLVRTKKVAAQWLRRQLKRDAHHMPFILRAEGRARFALERHAKSVDAHGGPTAAARQATAAPV